jgi:hypothetical protein
MTRAGLALAVPLALLTVVGGRAGLGADSADPLGPNAACYVCHMTFVREELSKTHLAAKVTCIKCHGVSAKHANDENIGATKPDRLYARDKINAMCRKCHKTHDVPPEAVIARWLERQVTQSPPVCTDCHGAHRLDRPEVSAQEQ